MRRQLQFRPDEKMYVIIACVHCHRQVQLLIENGWDIEDVHHDCAATKAFEIERRADGAQD